MAHVSPFASAATDLARRGLAVIPCGKDDGKRPSVRWTNSRLGPDSPVLEKWARQFPDANIGILTKPSGLTIIDIDAPDLANEMERRFGPTPLVTSTPSGGFHHWYRSNGERSRNLRRSEGLAVDIKAGGDSRGGFIVVPPSLRPSGPHAGKPYRFIRGGWDDLARLPNIVPGSLPDTLSRQTDKGSVAEPLFVQSIRDGNRVGNGQRNDTLFGQLMLKAPDCASEADLAKAAIEINSTFAPPMEQTEVRGCVKSVWGYRERGDIWTSHPARVTLTADELAAFQGDAHALMLYAVLRINHGARSDPFAISDKAMQNANVIPGWGRARYRTARDALLALGLLTQLHKGGNGAHDASRYALEKGSAE